MASSSPAGRTRTKKKITGAPDYDDAAFWDTKFATGQDVGEWLNSGEGLIEAVLSDLERRPLPSGRPRVLHLGPGISKLGTKLRDAFVRRGWMGNGIVNVDFSSEAVRLGQELESGREATQAMHWVSADLRSWDDIMSTNLSHFAPFDVILDKSTSDAIATSEPQIFSSSSDSGICPTVREIVDQNQNGDGKEISLSPVELLSLHLVPLTQKGTTWIALSYSTSRFDNLPHLAAHWRLVSRTGLPAPSGETSSSAAHTPQVFHWIYILQRK
ncbi:hypothetical protein VTN00DRAFT_6014 [Thermoascus crustaceus]|uniref:uncharacterized protein n=1 Tax=Thermoascus crustaceus TaxID=5088 RepID=UPI0037438432